jgi:hypothetical protein
MPAVENPQRTHGERIATVVLPSSSVASPWGVYGFIQRLKVPERRCHAVLSSLLRCRTLFPDGLIHHQLGVSGSWESNSLLTTCCQHSRLQRRAGGAPRSDTTVRRLSVACELSCLTALIEMKTEFWLPIPFAGRCWKCNLRASRPENTGNRQIRAGLQSFSCTRDDLVQHSRCGVLAT